MKAATARRFMCVALLSFAFGSGCADAARHAAAPPKPRTATITVTGERSGPDTDISVASVGDIPGHEIAQRIYSYALSSTDAKDFNGGTATNFAQTDTTGASGSHSGYAVWKLRNGDNVTIRFKGTHAVPSAAVAQAPYEGDFEFTGGTGKYRAIKGGARYEGVTTASGSHWKTTVKIEY
jgi:hypothetical protein